MISGIIKVEVGVTSLSLWLWLIARTETLITLHITKMKSNNCSLIHFFKENNEKRIILNKQINQPCSYFAVRMILRHL